MCVGVILSLADNTNPYPQQQPREGDRGELNRMLGKLAPATW